MAVSLRSEVNGITSEDTLAPGATGMFVCGFSETVGKLSDTSPDSSLQVSSHFVFVQAGQVDIVKESGLEADLRGEDMAFGSSFTRSEDISWLHAPTT